jgi:hypothetical protein
MTGRHGQGDGGGPRWRRALLALAASLVLSGCTARPAPAPEAAATAATGSPAALLAGCCLDAQDFPAWMAELTFGPQTGRPGPGDIILRPPRIGDRPEPRAFMARTLLPMDLVVQRYEGRLGGLVSPGRFSHTSIYLGTEAQLRAAGLWDLPELAPWRARIAAGDVLLDAMHTDVHLRDMGELLEVDALAVLRPRLDAAARAAALRRGLGLMGRRFDTDYDIADDGAIFCTELVHRAMPELGLPTTELYGRTVILPDAIAAGALLGALPIDVVAYVEGRPGGGVRALSALDLAQDMARHWPEPDDAPGAPATARGASTAAACP